MRHQRFDVLFLYICSSIVIGNYSHLLLPSVFGIRTSDMYRVFEGWGRDAGDSECRFLLEDLC